MDYQAIENYGIIGDLNTIALAGLNGSIDFLCFPDFDSPSIFAALVDAKKGGYYAISPVFKEMKTKQLYLPDTNVLLTRFLSVEGVGEITDFMSIEKHHHRKRLIRRVTAVRGEVRYRMFCRPRFNYGRSKHTVSKNSEHEIVFTGHHGDRSITFHLLSSVPLQEEECDAVAEFSLSAQQTADFVLEWADGHDEGDRDLYSLVTRSLFSTVNFWKEWIARSAYRGRWLETVNRSLLVLKLLSSTRYGSIIAAPTFGLPETIGGKRNWDYRYTWIRDASFTVYALVRMGYTREAGAFMGWIEKRCIDIKDKHPLGVMYSIGGERPPEETELAFEGYKRSRPVRTGNNAVRQLQLDIYGELLDAVYLYNKYGEPISYDFWRDLSLQIDWLCGNWNQPDEGIWEVRGGKQKFLYSRLQCWVALDRAVKIANTRSFPLNPEWMRQRDIIYNSVFEEFWNPKQGAFMQYAGSATVDASSLLMPLIRFISPKDPRWLSSLKRVETDLVSDSLVYRYKPEIAAPDGLTSREGTFSMCTFWYVECLSKSGQLEKARFYFEKMLGYANHLGLYGEQLGFEGEHLGNFPQAFTHLGLISAAYNLNHQLDDERNKNVEDPRDM